VGAQGVRVRGGWTPERRKPRTQWGARRPSEESVEA
jgi:hypothetical protein